MTNLPMHISPRCGARTKEREPVPLTSDAERPLSTTRRNVAGRTKG
jgi:hypothetical protein